MICHCEKRSDEAISAMVDGISRRDVRTGVRDCFAFRLGRNGLAMTGRFNKIYYVCISQIWLKQKNDIWVVHTKISLRNTAIFVFRGDSESYHEKLL